MKHLGDPGRQGDAPPLGRGTVALLEVAPQGPEGGVVEVLGERREDAPAEAPRSPRVGGVGAVTEGAGDGRRHEAVG